MHSWLGPRKCKLQSNQTADECDKNGRLQPLQIFREFKPSFLRVGDVWIVRILCVFFFISVCYVRVARTRGRSLQFILPFMPKLSTKLVCTEFLCKANQQIWILNHCGIESNPFFSIRLTSKNGTKITSYRLVKCHYLSFTLWCHWYSSCLVFSGCSCSKKARTYFQCKWNYSQIPDWFWYWPWFY